MGKQSYRHRKRWLEDKNFLNLLNYCRNLTGGHSKRPTKDVLARRYFGTDGAVNERRMTPILARVFYILFDEEGILFGPIKFFGEVRWGVAVNGLEKSQLFKYHGRYLNSRMRRLVGGEEYPKLKARWEKALDAPLRGLLSSYECLRDAAKEILPATTRECPHCGAEVYVGNFCGECGGKLA